MLYRKLLLKEKKEQNVSEEIKKLDDLLLDFRKKIREGNILTERGLKERLIALGYLK